MKKNLIGFLAIAAMFIYFPLFSQDGPTDNHLLKVTIPEVAIVDIESSGSKDIELVAVAPTEAGDPMTFTATNNTLWLNYSSIVPGPNNANKRRKITVEMSALVPGIDVKLAVGAYTGAGLGNKGTGVAGPTTLTTAAQDAVTDIGSCYTVDGVGNGHQLTYSFDIAGTNYGDIFAQDHEVTVTYTITDAN
jgi:hypothetical protein